ncbi:hypothetical protein B0A55_08939 [Friedmanniomyces simplex]|uniref:DUF1308 domain-containing protein n=1 Tax=Friedmanniomyces simplex TaxID=329884 RepID=A0A4U0X2F7_9PEZI|nr:hypothetical protein B0A55_08939 [Friedmanniomyces simplex]
MNGTAAMSATEQNGHNPDDQEPAASPVIDDLIHRARTLLSELEFFHERLRTLRRESHVELAHFRSTIQSEFNMLQRLSDKPDDDATKHVARSSNLPFLETIWSTAKASKDVVSLQKRIYTAPGVKSASQGMRHVETNGKGVERKGVKRGAVAVDAITDLGKTWTKVSHVTNQRLLFDLAKQGWNSGGSDYDDDEKNTARQDGDDDFDVPLLKTAKELTRAARCFRYGELPEVDTILDACRATGAILFLGDEQKVPPPVAFALHAMAPDPLASISDTLNIDCTVLLALVSEFSHAKVSKQPWFHTALQRQVEIEDNENLLPSLLYPAMSSRKLVCTHEAAKRMREIVHTIGTASEKARTAIMMGDDASKSRSVLLAEMQEWSAYDVPSDWQLPILTVDQNEGDCQRNLPPQAKEISDALTPINSSVFLYGWATGQTTVTSNRTILHQIHNALEAFDDLDDEAVWPPIWLCPTARSLVGKEKRGPKKAPPTTFTGGDDGKEGSTTKTAWPLPDSLRREQQRRNGLDMLARRQGLPEVEDRRPKGYRYEEVLAAKDTSLR